MVQKVYGYEFHNDADFYFPQVLMGQSDVAGWGIFLQRAADKDDLNSRSSVGTGLGSLACLKDQGHMVILDQASGAPDPVPISALAVKSLYLTRPSLF
ncbi:hypothetical protein Tco_0787316 [Tanacetum coccineum]